jgi:hypothetical protein
MASLAGHRHQEVERPLLADQREVERLPREPSALRGSQSAARRNPKKNHHRQDHNNSGAIIVAAPEVKIPEPLFKVCQRAALSPKLFSWVML